MTSVHYDRHSYMGAKRQALDAWSRLLQEIVGGEPMPSNVIRLAG